MTQEIKDNDAERVFDTLPDSGYSDKVSYLIWLWYHPEENCISDNIY
jgi:hypothetical protein